MLRFVHTADWHLGKRFSRFADEIKLTRARVDVLHRIFGVADRTQANAVLCAGDLFDDPNPAEEWWKALLACLDKTASTRPIILLPGNHDPLLPDSVWSAGHPFRKRLPAWVHVVDKDLFEFDLGDEAVLYAVPCRSKAGQRDPTETIPTRAHGDARVRVGLVHGSTFDLEFATTNFPISEDAAVQRGLDYLAIGDTHGFRYVPKDRLSPPTIYPGAPEPTAFDEKLPGHVAVVLINRQRQARVAPERVAQWTWEELRVTTLADLRALRTRSDLRGRVLRLTVEMSLKAAELDEAETILLELSGDAARSGRVDVLDLDRAGLVLDTSNFAELCKDLPQVLQRAATRLTEEERRPGRAAVAQRALMNLYRAARKAS